MEREEVGDDDDDEEAPLRERDLNLELRVAQEERHCTIVAMDLFYYRTPVLCSRTP